MNRQDVAAAIDTLESEGKRTSARAVREKIGRGNLSEIARHMRDLQGADSTAAEVAKLRRDLAERDRTIAARDRRIAELDATLAEVSAWARETHLRLASDCQSVLDRRKLMPPPQAPRLVTAERIP